MRVTILPKAIILTKAHRAAVSMIANCRQGVYCGLSSASEVFLVFITQLYQYFSAYFLFALFSDEPEVFLPKYSQTAILHAPRFQMVVNVLLIIWYSLQ